MKSGKKFAVAILAVATALALLVISAFALFSDRAQAATEGQIGTVDIDLTDFDLDDKTNINPGDYDPSNPDDSTPGTKHELTFKLKNLGNKSVDLRHCIIISVVDAAGKYFDPSVIRLFDNSKPNGTNGQVGTDELTEKFYLVEAANGTQRLEKALATTKDAKGRIKGLPTLFAGESIIAVVYNVGESNGIFNGEIFDGAGTAAEMDTTEGKANAANAITERSYSYYLSMDREADNNYQGLQVTIDIIAQAKQHRNTNNNSDWTTMFTKSISFGALDNYGVLPEVGTKADGTTPTDARTAF